MKRKWSQEELVEAFTLSQEEEDWISGTASHNMLGLAILLKVFQYQARFPNHPGEIPPDVVDYIAQQLGLTAALFSHYDWLGRTASRHRSAIREWLGFRETTVDDAESLIEWLAQHSIMNHDHQIAGLKVLAYRRLREQQLEPPTAERIERVVRSAVSRFEERLFDEIHRALPSDTLQSLDDLIATDGSEEEEVAYRRSVFATLKSDPGPLGIKADASNRIPMFFGIKLLNSINKGI